MVKSESELKRMTKSQLMQWLTKHDQRLPAVEKLKPYYLDRAISYFHLLEKEQSGMSSNKPSRSKIKHRGQIVSNTRTKKKLSSSSQSQQSRTPTSIRKKVIKTQRRHSTINTSSPTPSKSKSRKIIKVKRKTPSKQSPSLTKSIQRKRERVRRATADPAQLRQIEMEQQENQYHHIDDDDDDEEETEDEDDVDITEIRTTESEDGRDRHHDQYQQFKQNDDKRKFVCEKEPEQMTINGLQQWLNGNDINFSMGQRKKYYVDLVTKYRMPSSNTLSSFVSPVRNPPLPRNIRQSPLTPQDDEKSNNIRSRIPGKKKKDSGGLLITPALNKTGVSRIDTPSKLAMRDEIRTFLGFDDNDDPLLPVQDQETPGITPGGPSSYDANVLNDVLSDLRKENKSKPLSPKIKVYDSNKSKLYKDSDADHKENEVSAPSAAPSTSFINTFFNKISPHKPTSPSTIMDTINGVLSTNKKKIHKAHRTKPSPVSSPADSFGNSPVANIDNKQEEEQQPLPPPPVPYTSSHALPNNGNFKNNQLIPPTPPLMNNHHKYGQNNYHHHDDDMPQTPAIPNSNTLHRHHEEYQDPGQYLRNPRRSPRLKGKFDVKLPAKQQRGKKVKMKTPPNHSKRFQVQPPMDSPGIAPSMPSKIQSQAANLQQDAVNQASFEEKIGNKKKNKVFGFIFKLLIPTVLIACCAWAFHEYDGVDTMEMILNEITEKATVLINSFGAEQPKLFCDTGKNEIDGLQIDYDDNYECIQCPKHASHCTKGRAYCKTNYILQDNKCILDGITVKFAYQIKDQVLRILSERKGQYECGEIDDSEGYTMSEDELISKVEIIDQAKKFEAFAYFKNNILPEHHSISRNQKGQYFAYKSIKSPMCQIQEWIVSNTLFLVATFCLIMVFLIIYCQCKRKQNEKKEMEFMVGEIYRILEEHHQFNDNQHVPVEMVRQRIKPKSNKMWNDIDIMIQKDSRIQKSMRMIDGIQRKCWKLSSIPNVNNQSFQSNNNKMIKSSWSPSQPRSGVPQQQQQWNFNPNPNPNQNNNGFNLIRSNQMQSNDFDDDDKAEPTRFPPHSKRGMMW